MNRECCLLLTFLMMSCSSAPPAPASSQDEDNRLEAHDDEPSGKRARNRLPRTGKPAQVPNTTEIKPAEPIMPPKADELCPPPKGRETERQRIIRKLDCLLERD